MINSIQERIIPFDNEMFLEIFLQDFGKYVKIKAVEYFNDGSALLTIELMKHHVQLIEQVMEEKVMNVMQLEHCLLIENYKNNEVLNEL